MVLFSLILLDFSFHLRVGAMASDNLEDVLTKSGVDSALTNSLMMEGWTAQSFRMAAADSQGFEDVLQEWSSSHPLSVLQKACLRTAFQSLQPQQGPCVGLLNPASEHHYTSRVLGRSFSSQIGERRVAGDETKIHDQLPIRVDPCRPFSVDQISELGS